MPKEVRKRGRKHKGKLHPNEALLGERNTPTTSEMHKQEDANPDLPFGGLDHDLKAYFRTVDAQIQEWTTSGRNSEEQDECVHQSNWFPPE
jgi:nucleolar protein 9